MKECGGRGFPTRESEREELLELSVEGRAETFPGAKSAQRPLRGRTVSVVVEHPGGGRFSGSGLIRTLHVEKIEMLYVGMLHVGSRIMTSLPRVDSGCREIAGKVTSCRHVTRNIHEIVVELDEAADLAEFVPPSVLATLPQATATTPQMQGVCALLGSDPLDTRILSYHLRSPGLTLLSTTTIGQLLDVITAQDVDAAVIDHPALGPHSDASLERIMLAGLRGGVVVLVAHGTPRKQTAAPGTIRQMSVPRPATRDGLIDALAWVLKDVQPSVMMPIASSLRDEAARPLIAEYTRRIATDLARLQQLRESNSIDAVRVLLAEWRDSAGAFGFEPLGDAATTAVVAIDSSGSLDESAAPVRRALSIARRICKEPAPTTPNPFVLTTEPPQSQPKAA